MYILDLEKAIKLGCKSLDKGGLFRAEVVELVHFLEWSEFVKVKLPNSLNPKEVYTVPKNCLIWKEDKRCK